MNKPIEEAIQAFIVENFLFGDDSQRPGKDDSLIDNDIVDSTGILELVAFLEERYALAVADSEIVPDNFDTVARLAAYAAGKLESLDLAG